MAGAHGDHLHLQPGDSRRLEGAAWTAFVVSLGCGIVGLVAALLLAVVQEHGFQRLGYSYLVGFSYVLSLAVGCLLFTMLTFLFRAGWVVLVRRPAEVVAGSFPILLALVVPVLIYVFAWNGHPYGWAQEFADAHGHHGETHHQDEGGGEGQGHDHGPGEATQGGESHGSAAPAVHEASVVLAQHAEQPNVVDPPLQVPHVDEPDHSVANPERFPHEAQGADHILDRELRDGETAYMSLKKRDLWLNAPFFALRMVVYFLVFSALGVWFWRTSTRQDLTGDAGLTRKMEVVSAPGLILFATALTFCAFDLLMSLDPTWFSSMLPVYYFAGSFQATLAFLILTLMGLQSLGFLPSVTKEHYHDLGKLMFAFVVFWAYIGFSQYMLIWYAAIPAEQPWMINRGLSTNEAHMTPWNWVAIALLVGRFFIPFFGLMSRHVKRNKATLAFWAAWLLVMHFVDVYWLVMPEYVADFAPVGTHPVPLPLQSLACLLGVGGVFFAVAIRLAARNALVPVGDPRLKESLGFHNI